MSDSLRTAPLSKAALRRSFRIFRYLSPYKLKFGLGMACLLFSSVTFMVFPGLIGRLIGSAEAGPSPLDRFFDVDGANNIALWLLLAFAVQALFSFLRVVLFAEVTERAIAALRRDVYAHLISLPMAYFNSKRVGELTSRTSNDIGQLQEFFMTVMAELVRQFIIIVVGVALLFFFSVELTLVMLISLPIMMLVAFFFGRFIRSLSKKTQAELALSQVVVDETLQGIQSVKAYGNEGFELNRYSAALKRTVDVALLGAKWRGAFASFIVFGLFGSVVLVIWYGSVLRNEGAISLDVFTSFILYSVFVGGSIGGMADVFGRIQKAVGATENLFEIMAETAEPTVLNSEVPHVKINGSIAFRKVHFNYASRPDKPVLRGLTFDVKAGERVAIVGSSGAGKSTVAALLLRFYDVDSGDLLIDEKPAKSYPLASLRNQMAFVPQELMLFGGTIRENIAYGKPTATDEEVRMAAKKANTLEFIDSFPDGMSTVVGERGVQLSGGQKQRVVIARAILKDPKILILDEATSSLDAESERTVQQALDTLMQGRTSIIIAHRLSTVQSADNIVVLEAGTVCEMGTHEQLMAIENGVYRRLCRLQEIA